MNKINWQERLNQLLSTGKNKSYFTAGVTVLFVVVMAIIGVVPAVSSLGQQSEDNKKRDQVLGLLEKKLSDLKTMTLEKENQQELVDYFDEIMPNQESQEAVISLLNKLGEDQDVIISSYSFDRDSRELKDSTLALFGERVIPMYITIVGDGSKDNIMSFINDLENSARILKIDEVVITRGTEEDNSAPGTLYTFNLKLIIYYFN